MSGKSPRALRAKEIYEERQRKFAASHRRQGALALYQIFADQKMEAAAAICLQYANITASSNGLMP